MAAMGTSWTAGLALGTLCALAPGIAQAQSPGARPPAPHAVRIDTAEPGGSVWLRAVQLDGKLSEPISCYSPCDLVLWPGIYRITVDDAGRSGWQDYVNVYPNTRSLRIVPRQQVGDVFATLGLVMGPLVATGGLLAGVIRGAGCDEAKDASGCRSDAMMSAAPIWGAGIGIFAAGLTVALLNTSWVTVDGMAWRPNARPGD